MVQLNKVASLTRQLVLTLHSNKKIKLAQQKTEQFITACICSILDIDIYFLKEALKNWINIR